MQAVQCMADELRADGRAFDVRFAQGFGYRRTHAKLGYGFRDAAGGRHYTWKELIPYQAGGCGYDGRKEYFEATDPSHTVRRAWETKCHVSPALYTQ